MIIRLLKTYLFFLVAVLLMWLTAPELGFCPPAAPGPPGMGPPGAGPGPPGASPPGRKPVPEPATAILIGTGALGVYGYKKYQEARRK